MLFFNFVNLFICLRVPLKCASDTDFEHNYFQNHQALINTPNIPVKLLRVTSENIIESPGRSQYVRVNGTCRKNLNEEEKQNTCTVALTNAEITLNKPCSSKSLFPAIQPVSDGCLETKSSALLNAMKTINSCRSMLTEIQNTENIATTNLNSNIRTDIKSTPLKLNNDVTPINASTPVLKNETILIDSDSDGKETPTMECLHVRRSKRVGSMKRKSYLEMHETGNTDNVINPLNADEERDVDQEKTIVVESDPEDLFNPSAFEDNDLNQLQDKKEQETAKPSFLSNICPDLLQMNQNVSKRQRVDVTPPPDENPRIQALLKEKHEQIEENRRKALERRWSSLKRKSMF